MTNIQPQKYPIQVNVWQKMADFAVFPPDSPRLELINGEILQMPPIGYNHAGHLKRLNKLFNKRVGDLAICSVQDPLCLGEISEPEPDFMLLKPDKDFYTTRHPEACDVLLLIEIASSSLNFDREQKMRLYASHGIVEYWLLNLNNESLEVYLQPAGEYYAQKSTLYYTDTINLSQLPDITIRMADILSH